MACALNRFLCGDPGLTFGQWAAALHLATMWSFDEIREVIILQMDETIPIVDAMDRVDASLKCRVEKWLHPAYEELCNRETALSDVEAERLGFRRSMAIWRIREALRSTRSPATQSNCSGFHQMPMRGGRGGGRGGRGGGRGRGRGGRGGFRSINSSAWNAPAMSAVIIQTENAQDLIQREEALKFP